jgi:hypothetical protein
VHDAQDETALTQRRILSELAALRAEIAALRQDRAAAE